MGNGRQSIRTVVREVPSGVRGPSGSGGTNHVLERVRRLFAEGTVVYECRDCGTTLDPHADDCEACGSADVARYAID